jgi:hypothetical protein
VCDPQSGACSNQLAPNGTSCNDGSSCTAGDSCTAGTCSGTPVPAPDLINNSVRVNKTPTNATISWTDAPGNYNAYRGSKSAGAVFAYNHTCLSANVGANSADDTGTPLQGQLFFYLVSRVSACGESSLGTNSSGATRPNVSACVVP